MSERVIAYIDGFNLYFGLKDKGWRCYYWLNVKLLCQNLINPEQQLVLTKYFTSRIKNNPEKQKRQAAYLDALNTIPDLIIRYGRYKNSTRTCRNCGDVDDVPTEKMTDVRIASELITDAIQNRYDTALLITGDGDLVPAIEAVKEIAPGKKIIIASPPRRYNSELTRTAGSQKYIYENVIKASLLPDKIKLPNGFILQCPDYWK